VKYKYLRSADSNPAPPMFRVTWTAEPPSTAAFQMRHCPDRSDSK
jgi:hypothetical protein